VPACFDRHANLLSQAEHLAVRKIVGACAGKIVEGALGNADDVMLDKLRAFDDFAGAGTDDLANRKMLGLA
jgi:hypothetical protein